MSEQLSSNLRENKVLDNKKRMRVGAFTANVFKQNGGDAVANPEGSGVWTALLQSLHSRVKGNWITSSRPAWSTE